MKKPQWGVLHLSRSGLTTLDWNCIVHALSDEECASVTSLRLDHNALSEITSLSRFVNLKILCCNNNLLTHLNGISALHSLRFLQCGENNITLLDEIEHLTCLTSLVCEANNLQWLPDCSRLTSLDVVLTVDNIMLPNELQVWICDIIDTTACVLKWCLATAVHHKVRTRVRPAALAVLRVAKRRRAERDVL